MANWLNRQYADIRGNFKWGLLMFLWWLITTFGKKALSLIPNIPEWLTYTILCLSSVIAFLWIATMITRSQQFPSDEEVVDRTDDDSHFKQLFMSESSAREKYQDRLTLATLEIERLKAAVDSAGARNREVKITKLSDQVEYAAPLGFPLKLRIQMRNDSQGPIDVQLKEYKPNKIAASPKGFPLEVLQLRFGNQWYPQGDGVDRISVVPMQQFQAWIGFNERLSNKAEVESHRGQIGTLVLLVNNHHIEVPL